MILYMHVIRVVHPHKVEQRQQWPLEQKLAGNARALVGVHLLAAETYGGTVGVYLLAAETYAGG